MKNSLRLSSETYHLVPIFRPLSQQGEVRGGWRHDLGPGPRDAMDVLPRLCGLYIGTLTPMLKASWIGLSVLDRLTLPGESDSHIVSKR
jgi:hypothetical protein